MTTEQLCRHEAGHACAAALLGLSVRLVDTVPRAEATPGGGLYVIFGEVRHSGERIVDRESARRRMIVSLCGPLESAEGWDDMPHWPLSEHADTTDERSLWALADWLELDERGYHEILLEAIDLTLAREYRLLHTAVTGMLDYVPRVDPDLFLRLHTLARGH